jgi:hypothetical protein
MSDMKDMLRRKRERDKSAYEKGFEEGGFAGAASVAGIFLFVVYVLIPLIR